jgi:hypothetical protein
MIRPAMTAPRLGDGLLEIPAIALVVAAHRPLVQALAAVPHGLLRTRVGRRHEAVQRTATIRLSTNARVTGHPVDSSDGMAASSAVAAAVRW